MTRVQLDSLVRGKVGSTQVIDEMRVFRVSPHGWAAGINADGKQRIMYDFEVVGEPRPATQRRDIPSRLT